MLRRIAITLALTASLALGLAASATPATAGPAHRCGTPERIALAKTKPRPPVSVVAHAGPKLVRASFGGTFTQLESTNFSVHWRDNSVTTAQAQVVLDALELSWTTFQVNLGHRVPTGCDTYKLNAYISRETDTPSIDFEGGYATLDDEGYPYFVISRGMFTGNDFEDAVRGVVAHEYYHDVQFSMDGYGPYPWFWEATAEWGAMQALPGEPEPFGFTGAYFLRSELPLFHFGNFNADFIPGVHQYGASIFWRYLTDELDDPQLIVQAWETATGADEPITKVFSLAGGVLLPDFFQQFVERAAYLDFATALRQPIIRSLGQFTMDPDLDRLSAIVPAAGTPMTTLALPLHSYGFMTFELLRPATSRAEVTLALADTLNVPSVALHASVVRATPAGFTATPLALGGLTSTTVIEFPPEALSTRLVVWVSSIERRGAQPYRLSYAVTPAAAPVPEPEPEPEPEPDDDINGCCSTTGTGSGVASSASLALIAAVLMRRRRARR